MAAPLEAARVLDAGDSKEDAGVLIIYRVRALRAGKERFKIAVGSVPVVA